MNVYDFKLTDAEVAMLHRLQKMLEAEENRHFGLSQVVGRAIAESYALALKFNK